MKVVAIVQARMGSTRLPGKVLMKVMGKSLLEYQIERMQRAKSITEIVIATSTKQKDDPIIDLCNQLSVSHFRGSEHDVLDRFYRAAEAYDAEAVVRLTADCPLIDPEVIDQVVDYYVKNHYRYDYGSNTEMRSYPRGMDTSIFSFKALEQACREARLPFDREHVTPFIIRNEQRFPSFHITYSQDASHHRWTVDTKEDFQLIEHILKELYPKNEKFTLKDTLNVFENHPEWLKINDHIRQKDS
ncbi:cytidylyltransferase domain-containing protein [Halobacillus sp. H74]|uniref:cytidylyltransferase domain-containing protein n=1 Tax=Halobacillus sp. H74 TaxID=3457436 RepID=UPI003FCDDB40